MATQVPRPQQLPQTYRGPRGVTLTDERDEDEHTWSDSPSGSDDSYNGPSSRKTSEAPRNTDLDRLRNRQRPSGPARLAHVDNYGEGGRLARASTLNPRTSSHPGGQAVPYDASNGYPYPQPSNPMQTPFSATTTSPYYTASPYPTNSYFTSPYPYPTNTYPTNIYPTNAYPSNLYSQNAYPTSNYPYNPGYSADPYPHQTPYIPPNTSYSADSYARDPAYMSPQTYHQVQPEPVVKHRQRHSVDGELEQIKRDTKNMKMEDTAKKKVDRDRRREEEHWRKKDEAARLEREKTREFEEMKKHKDREDEAKRDRENAVKAKRDEEIQKIVQKETRELREVVEKIAAGRQSEDVRLEDVGKDRDRNRERDRKHMDDDRRRLDSRNGHGDILGARRRSDSRSFDGGSVGGSLAHRRRSDSRSWDEGSVGVSLGGHRRRSDSRDWDGRSASSIQTRTSELTKSDIKEAMKEVVLDLFPLRRLDSEPQASFAERKMYSSRRSGERKHPQKLLRRSPASEPYDVGARVRNSELRSSSEVSDRYARSESNDGSITSYHSMPTSRQELGRKKPIPRKSDRAQSRASRHGLAGSEHQFPPETTLREEESRKRTHRPRRKDIRQETASLDRPMRAPNERYLEEYPEEDVEDSAETSSSESDADDPPPTRSRKYHLTPNRGSGSDRSGADEKKPEAPEPPRRGK